jgi:signal transduction histidine kinase/CheY-like chemotaxis protein
MVKLNDELERRVEERTLQLKDSLDFARLAFSAVGGVGVWTFDAIKDVFSYDAAIAELYDLDPERGFAGIPRKDFLANVHPEDRASLSVTMSGGLVKPGDLELEYRILHSDGSVRTVLSKGHTYFDEHGTPIRRTGVGVDMTDKRALEDQVRQSQKMEAVGQLSGGLAHDFNNLLAGIGGSLSVMQTRLVQGRIVDLDRYLTAAQGAVKRGSNLTQRMLAFSRRQTLDPQPTDVNRLVNGMLDLIGRSVGPGISVETVALRGLWTTFVDASQLENALLNLSINARDAMPDGGKLTIETGNKWLDDKGAKERDLPPGQYVTLCVSDNGVGMTKETISRAFDPFYTTKPIGQGTGLGLSMVHGFAGQSGGATRIYSEVGQGTTVCIYLPRHHGAAAADEVETRANLPRSDNRETILLVDDEPLLRMVVAEQLDELGYHVLEAGDGPTALKLVASNWPIDLLITDVGLPNGLNGRQLADAVRMQHPELNVLYITGYAENAVLNHGHLDVGMHVLTKPFDMDMFAGKVKTIISEKR